MQTLLSATDIAKAHGRQVVLDDLSFVVSDRMRVGLIGRNGSGKTTLLRILAGQEEADRGSVRRMPALRLGVLDQHETLPEDRAAIAYLTEKSGRPDWECRKLAARFGLSAASLGQIAAQLSGGYQMRVKIVRMLLADPNLLLLDEPVNYLDLPTMLLFESFLATFTGSFVITSHDREILENLCTTTWEVERGKLTVFPGDVETYLDWKEEQAEYARRTNKRLRREIAHVQEFVDRFKFKASLASRAQSKMKHIAKLRTKLKSLDRELPTAAFRITCPPFPNGHAVRTDGLAIGYDGKPVASGITLEIPRGAKAAIVGENGRGKSTLLRTFAGKLPAISGKLQWWHRADIGYYSQLAPETLSPGMTVLQALTLAAPPDASGERILAAAGTFLFREDDLEKTCGVLSGGEQARVRLARLVLGEHNVLLLDEPTNHLDAETVDVLAQAIKDYPGTVIAVSHARTFMNGFADRIFEVRDGGVRQWNGTYEEYVADLATQAVATSDLAAEPGDTPEATERRERSARAKETRRRRKAIEDRLAVLDKERSGILAFFFENPMDYAPDKATRLTEIDDEVAVLEKEWMGLE
jgi:ATP-binding cassette, subfamily F, member 3